MVENIITSCFLALMALMGQGQTVGQPAHQSWWHHRNTTIAPSPSPVITSGPTSASSEIASEQTCPGQTDPAKTAPALTCLTINARIFHHVAPVKANATLMAAATAKDQDILTCGYGHTACGRAANYWLQNKGYTGRCSGENIAYGQKSPREVFTAWMNSAGHRANILSADFRDLGVAETSGPHGPLWVMELGGC